MATKKIKINFKMPTPTAAERLHALQQKNRKAAGLPDPSEYKKKLDSMKTEEVNIGDKVSFDHPMTAIPGKTMKKVGTVHKIEGDMAHVKVKDKYGVMTHKKNASELKKENYEEDDGPLSQEQLDEISSQLKASYVSGAKKQIKQSLPFTKKTDEYRDIAKNFIAKRQKGIAKANEEVELLDEMPESSMKTRDVHSHLKKSGWELARSKGGHDVYKHPKAKHSIPVPRHNQLKAPLIRGIMKASKVQEGVTIGGLVGRGNIYQYDRNPGPRDDDESDHVPYVPKTEKQKKLQKALTDLGNKMKQTHPKLREAKDSQEYDYEGDMAKSDLRSIMHNAKELHDMIEDNTNLAEWCQSKITLAEDYISTVTNYMRSEMNEGAVPSKEETTKVKHHQSGKELVVTKRAVERYKQQGYHPVKEEVKKNEYHIAGKHKFPTKDEHAVTVKHTESGREHVHSGKGKYLSKLIKTRYNINHYFEEVELDEEVKDEYSRKVDKYLKKKHASGDSKKKLPQGADFAAQRRKERLAKSGRMDEGRASQRHPLEGHEYHKKSNEALVHIAKDAHAAAEAMKSHNTDAENKYRDQANDSATVRHFRKTSGMPDWYKKKYGHVKEEVELDEKKNLPGLWANIRAKKARGESPAKPGDKDYPEDLESVRSGGKKSVKESTAEPTEGEMKGKQGYSRKAQIVMNAAKGKKSDSPDKFQKDPELSSEIHKT